MNKQKQSILFLNSEYYQKRFFDLDLCKVYLVMFDLQHTTKEQNQ